MNTTIPPASLSTPIVVTIPPIPIPRELRPTIPPRRVSS